MMNADTTVGAPADAIAAVTHADPYNYYAHLVAERPFYREAALGLWVATSARAVTAVLSSPAGRVRPAAELVPRALGKSRAAAIFGGLVRMNDGEMHQQLRPAVMATLDALDPERLGRESARQAASLARGLGPETEPARLLEFAFAVSTHVLGSLLAIAEEALPAVTQQVSAFVRSLVPGCSLEELERGKSAAEQLYERFLSQYQRALSGSGGNLLAELASQAHRSGCHHRDRIAANGIGFLTQAFDATAGLIGKTLLTLARLPEVRERIAHTPGSLATVVDEVLRYDSPVQNTRRFVAEPVTIEGQELQPGDTVVVGLAAANRDPQASRTPALQPGAAGSACLYVRRRGSRLPRADGRNDDRHRSGGGAAQKRRPS